MMVAKFDDSDFQEIDPKIKQAVNSQFDDSDFEQIKDYTPVVNPDKVPVPTAQPQQVSEMAPGVPNTTMAEVGDKALAGLGTIGDVGIDIGKGAVDITTYVLDKMGIIAPDTANKLYSAVESGANELRPSLNAPFKESMARYPAGVSVGRAAGDVYGMMRGQGLMGRGTIGQTVMGGLTSTALGSNEVIGTVMNTPITEKDAFAVVGAAGQPILSLLGYGIKTVAIRSTLGNKIKEIVSIASSKIKGLSVDDEVGQSVANMHNAVDKVSKELYDASTSNNPIHKITYTPQSGQNLLNKYSGESEAVLGDLTAGVKKYISDTSEMLNQPKSSHDLLQNYYAARNLTTQAYKSVRNGRLNLDVANDIKQLQIAAEKDLEAALKQEGSLDKFVTAKKFYKDNIVPLDNFGADDIAKAYKNKEADPGEWAKQVKGLYTRAASNPLQMKATLKAMDKTGQQIMERGILADSLSPILDNIDDFNYAGAYTKLNEMSRIMKGVLSEETLTTLQGVNRLILEAGKQSKIIHTAGQIGSIAAGGTIGGMIGSKFDSEGNYGGMAVGAGLGSAAGIVAFPIIIKAINGMLQHPMGQQILNRIGASSPESKMSGDLIKTLYTTWLPEYIRMTKEPEPKKANPNANEL